MLCVYTVIHQYLDIDSGETYTSTIGVYGEFESAERVFNECIELARLDFEDYDTEEEKADFGKEEVRWSIYEKDYELTHRYNLVLQRIREG